MPPSIRAVADRYLPFATTLALTEERQLALGGALPFIGGDEAGERQASGLRLPRFHVPAARRRVWTIWSRR